MRRALLLCTALSACSEYAVSVPVEVDPEAVTECAFEPVEDRPAVQRYTCNPVFDTTGEDWADRLGGTAFLHADVMGHPFYQVWYVGAPEDSRDWQLGYAASADGTTWTAHPANPGWPERDRDDWDGGWMQAPRVAWDAAAQRYWLLYGGISQGDAFFGVGLAGSTDGHSWETLPENPVLSLSGLYDGVSLDWPVAFDIRDGAYEAWFAGSEEAVGRQDLYRLQTADVTSWAVPAERVFKHARDGAWDDQGFIDAATVELDGVEYLFYVGFGELVEEGNTFYSDQAFVGLATRRDGEDWERAGSDPLPMNLTQHGNVTAIAAQAIGSRVHLWVTDWYEELGRAAVGYYLYEPALDEDFLEEGR